MAFEFRGLELHGGMWDRWRIVHALDFIKRTDMNALVIHETDIIQQITYPRSYLNPYGLWKSAPTRRGENRIENNRVYFDHILQLARREGIDVWIEVKEIGFPDEILELRPELLKNGTVCPTEPFWYEYLERRTNELFEDFPLIKGMITSPGSQEGKASRPQNKCGCAICQATSVEDWYHNIIMALHRPSVRHGKRLVLRDFAYKPVDHEPLINAVARAPDDIVFCIKVTPHDFYLTFPDNPALGRLKREQWIEYDVHGQFFGWGIFPCLVLDDLRARFATAEKVGVKGGIFRTEWERINDLWCFETLNEINAIAAAALAKGETVDAVACCRRWLEAHSWSTKAAPWLAETLIQTWPIMKRALYANDFVFADNSMFPRSVARAWWGMETRDSLHVWDPARAKDLQLDRASLGRWIAEKEEAVARMERLHARVKAGDPSLPEGLHKELVERFDLFRIYIDGFRKCGKVCFYARWFEKHDPQDKPNAADRAAFEQALKELEAFIATIKPIATDARYRHQIVLLLDYRRAQDILREGREALANAAAPAKQKTGTR